MPPPFNTSNIATVSYSNFTYIKNYLKLLLFMAFVLILAAAFILPALSILGVAAAASTRRNDEKSQDLKSYSDDANLRAMQYSNTTLELTPLVSNEKFELSNPSSSKKIIKPKPAKLSTEEYETQFVVGLQHEIREIILNYPDEIGHLKLASLINIPTLSQSIKDLTKIFPKLPDPADTNSDHVVCLAYNLKKVKTLWTLLKLMQLISPNTFDSTFWEAKLNEPGNEIFYEIYLNELLTHELQPYFIFTNIWEKLISSTNEKIQILAIQSIQLNTLTLPPNPILDPDTNQKLSLPIVLYRRIFSVCKYLKNPEVRELFFEKFLTLMDGVAIIPETRGVEKLFRGELSLVDALLMMAFQLEENEIELKEQYVSIAVHLFHNKKFQKKMHESKIASNELASKWERLWMTLFREAIRNNNIELLHAIFKYKGAVAISETYQSMLAQGETYFPNGITKVIEKEIQDFISREYTSTEASKRIKYFVADPLSSDGVTVLELEQLFIFMFPKKAEISENFIKTFDNFTWSALNSKKPATFYWVLRLCTEYLNANRVSNHIIEQELFWQQLILPGNEPYLEFALNILSTYKNIFHTNLWHLLITNRPEVQRLAIQFLPENSGDLRPIVSAQETDISTVMTFSEPNLFMSRFVESCKFLADNELILMIERLMSITEGKVFIYGPDVFIQTGVDNIVDVLLSVIPQEHNPLLKLKYIEVIRYFLNHQYFQQILKNTSNYKDWDGTVLFLWDRLFYTIFHTAIEHDITELLSLLPVFNKTATCAINHYDYIQFNTPTSQKMKDAVASYLNSLPQDPSQKNSELNDLLHRLIFVIGAITAFVLGAWSKGMGKRVNAKAKAPVEEPKGRNKKRDKRPVQPSADLSSKPTAPNAIKIITLSGCANAIVNPEEGYEVNITLGKDPCLYINGKYLLREKFIEACSKQYPDNSRVTDNIITITLLTNQVREFNNFIKAQLEESDIVKNFKALIIQYENLHARVKRTVITLPNVKGIAEALKQEINNASEEINIIEQESAVKIDQDYNAIIVEKYKKLSESFLQLKAEKERNANNLGYKKSFTSSYLTELKDFNAKLKSDFLTESTVNKVFDDYEKLDQRVNNANAAIEDWEQQYKLAEINKQNCKEYLAALTAHRDALHLEISRLNKLRKQKHTDYLISYDTLKQISRLNIETIENSLEDFERVLQIFKSFLLENNLNDNLAAQKQLFEESYKKFEAQLEELKVALSNFLTKHNSLFEEVRVLLASSDKSGIDIAKLSISELDKTKLDQKIEELQLLLPEIQIFTPQLEEIKLSLNQCDTAYENYYDGILNPQPIKESENIESSEATQNQVLEDRLQRQSKQEQCQTIVPNVDKDIRENYNFKLLQSDLDTLDILIKTYREKSLENNIEPILTLAINFYMLSILDQLSTIFSKVSRLFKHDCSYLAYFYHPFICNNNDIEAITKILNLRDKLCHFSIEDISELFDLFSNQLWRKFINQLKTKGFDTTKKQISIPELTFTPFIDEKMSLLEIIIKLQTIFHKLGEIKDTEPTSLAAKAMLIIRARDCFRKLKNTRFIELLWVKNLMELGNKLAHAGEVNLVNSPHDFEEGVLLSKKIQKAMTELTTNVERIKTQLTRWRQEEVKKSRKTVEPELNDPSKPSPYAYKGQLFVQPNTQHLVQPKTNILAELQRASP